jgi:cytochrome P450
MSTFPPPPGPTGAALLRTLMSYTLDPFRTLVELAERYGDIVGFGTGPLPVILVNRPELIEAVLERDNRDFAPVRPLTVQRAMGDGLFTSVGDLHDRQRRLIGPLLHGERITRFGDVIAGHGERLSARWQPGRIVDIERAMLRLVVEAIAEVLFGDDAARHREELVHPALPVNAYLGTRSTHPFAGVPEAIPLLPDNRAFWRAMRALDRGLVRLIQRRRDTADRGDLLSALLIAGAEDGGGMSDRQVRDEVIALYTTGNAVTAGGLMWTWYLLGEHPDVAATLHAELDTVLEGRPPAADDLSRLPYTEMVLAESMRLFPPAWTVGRRALRAYTLDRYGAPVGATLVLSSFVTQRDPRNYPDPLRFDPERWTPEARAGRPRFAYFPFSGGPRGCLGEEFAWMMMRLLLATLAQQWQPVLVHDQALRLEPLIALRPKGGMRMALQRRDAAQG